MQTATPDPLLVRSLQYIAGSCDGAETEDGVGFNGTDTHFGKALADIDPSGWSPENVRHAWDLLRKYRGQLARGGIDYDAIKEPPAVDCEAAIRVVDYRDSIGILIRVPYGDSANPKYGLSARWNREARCWVIPSRRWVDVLAFASEEALSVTSAAHERLAAAMQGETPETELTGTVDVSDEAFTLRFDYDPSLVAAVRDIPGRAWNADAKVWKAPFTSVRAVKDFAARHHLQLTPEAEAVPDCEPLTGPVIDVVGGQFAIRFDYERDLISRVRDLPGARWNARAGAWLVDLDATLEVTEFAVATEAVIGAKAGDVLAGATEALQRIEASAAKDAELVIPGLGGELLPFQRAGVRYALEAMGYEQAEEGTWTRQAEPALMGAL